MKLSELVKSYRDEHNLALRTFADQAHVSHQYVEKIEKEKIKKPSAKLLKQLAEAMGMSIHDLLEVIDEVEINYESDESMFLCNEEEKQMIIAYRSASEPIKQSIRLILGIEKQ